MSQQMARRNSRPNPKKQPDSRTKFDVWLEDHLSSGESIFIVMHEDPFLVKMILGNQAGKCEYEASVLTVDRYNVYFEINHPLTGDSVPVWIAKDNIISAR